MKKRTAEPAFISPQVKRSRRFYFGLDDASPGVELTVVGGGWELVSKDYTMDRRTFPWLAVEFVAGGVGKLHFQTGSHDLRRGVFFAYGPGIYHRIETDPKEVLSKYYLNFNGREALDLMSALATSPGGFCALADPDEIEEMFEALIDEGVASKSQAPAIMALQLRILFLRIARLRASEAPAWGRSMQMVRQCISYIDQHFLRTRTIEEVSKACRVSIGYLTRSFSRFGYGSPYRYLVRKKMVHAAMLLDSGSMMVGEVANRMDIDPFQFSRMFKRVHGISPSEFRQRHGVVAPVQAPQLTRRSPG